MASISVAKIECLESRGDFGRFVAEPLERGFATTLGNALRRVLLAYLPGAAVTHVKIEGVLHEFSPLPGVKEDVLDFLLNVKALHLRPVSGRAGKLILDVSGEREVYARDISPSNDFVIVNPDLYLATIDSSEARLYAEFDADIGIGYQPAGSGAKLPVGTIPVDAVFAPVRKVNFDAQSVAGGGDTNLEKLVIEIWTDGTISPALALGQAARILSNQLAPFAAYERGSGPVQEIPELVPTPGDVMSMPVSSLGLPKRVLDALSRSNIATVGDIMSGGEEKLLSIRNLGKKSLEDIIKALKRVGLSLPSGEEGLSEEEE